LSSLDKKGVETAPRQRDNQAGRAPHWRPLDGLTPKKGQRGGNDLTGGKHLGCGRLGKHLRGCSSVWRPFKAVILAVTARLVCLLFVMWGLLCIMREDPARALLTDARAPVGSVIPGSSEWG
jgi:hypothetical protein